MNNPAHNYGSGFGYMGNPKLRRAFIQISMTQDQVDEFKKCSQDPEYFIRKYVKIVALGKGIVPFDLYDFQADMINTFNNNRFVICKIPRQSGKCFDINTIVKIKNTKTKEIFDTTIGDFYELVQKEQRPIIDGIHPEATGKIQRQGRGSTLCQMSLLRNGIARFDFPCEKNTQLTTKSIFNTISFKKPRISPTSFGKNKGNKKSWIWSFWKAFSMVGKVCQERSQHNFVEGKSSKKPNQFNDNRLLVEKNERGLIASAKTTFRKTINIFSEKMYSKIRGTWQRYLGSTPRKMDEFLQETKFFQNITNIVSQYYGEVPFGNRVFCGMESSGHGEIQEQRISSKIRSWDDFTRLYRYTHQKDNRVQWNLLAWEKEQSRKGNAERTENNRQWLFLDDCKRGGLQEESRSNSTGLSKLSDSVERKFIDSIPLEQYEVWTDTGWQKTTYLHKTIKYKEWILKTENHSLICADTHIVFRGDGKEVFIKDLKVGNLIRTNSGNEKVVSIQETDSESHMYDLTIDSCDHCFYTNGILSHNTITTVAYLLWTIIFTPMVNIAIAAHKGPAANGILQRLKLAYENLPLWLQHGIIEWNKGNIELENGSKIGAFATTADGLRSGSYDIVLLDEFAFVPNNIAEAFYTSTYPVITAGTNTKVFIISTPKGMNHFYTAWVKAIKKKSEFIPIEVHWSAVPGRDEAWKAKTISNTSEEQFRQEFECLAGETQLELFDTEKNEYKIMSIEELYLTLNS